MPDAGTIEALLTRTFDAPVHIQATKRIDPWCVMRCELASDHADVPASVVVKWVRDGRTGDVRTEPARLDTERAALEFVASIDPTLVPHAIAADHDQGLLVIEDLSPREPLRDVLLRDGADQAAPHLVAFARALGRMAGATVGRADEYYARRHAYGPADRRKDLEQVLATYRTGLDQLANAGNALTGRAEAELAQAVDELTGPDAVLAFSNGDVGVNNFLVDETGDGRIIDFEGAGYRHPLGEPTDLYVPGPMWITVGDPMANGVEAAYREQLAEAVPAANDDIWYGKAVCGAAFLWAARRLSTLPKMDARPAGDQSRLHRVAVLEAAADTAVRHHCLPHLTSWARSGAATLRRRWPDADVDLTALPAYTTRY